MSVSLCKGQTVSLAKDCSVNNISVCLGWKQSKYCDDGDFDLDASCFVIQKNGMTRQDQDFVFYGNLEHPSKAIRHTGDDVHGGGDGDNETIHVKLSKLPGYADKIVFVVTIYEAERRLQNFGMIEDPYVRVVDNNNKGREILKYELRENFGDKTAIVVGEIYRDECDWRFRAVGQGFEGGLSAMCNKYGVEVR